MKTILVTIPICKHAAMATIIRLIATVGVFILLSKCVRLLLDYIRAASQIYLCQLGIIDLNQVANLTSK